MAKRQSRTSVEMRPLIEAYQDSGLTQKAFCELHELPFSVFQYWYKKLRPAQLTEASSFKEVEVQMPAGQADHLIVRYPSGMEVRIPVG